jgi:hypothetical protein
MANRSKTAQAFLKPHVSEGFLIASRKVVREQRRERISEQSLLGRMDPHSCIVF